MLKRNTSIRKIRYIYFILKAYFLNKMKLLAVEEQFLYFLVYLFATYFTAFHVKQLGVWALLEWEKSTSSNKLRGKFNK